VVAWPVTGNRVVRGQPVSRAKVDLAVKLRREMTPQEVLLWRQLRAGKLEGLHFRRQQVIDGFVVDFYCDAASLVVEVDGAVHADRREYDAERDRILSARDLVVLRFTNTELEHEMRSVLQRISIATNARLRDREPPEPEDHHDNEMHSKLPFPPREGAGG
jgi:very-short-patch-repair endonuclease